MRYGKEVMSEIDRIVESRLTDLDKVVQVFDVITTSVIEAAEREMELLRAMGDGESLVKEQIKMETVRHARAILNECTMRVIRRRAWHE